MTRRVMRPLAVLVAIGALTLAACSAQAGGSNAKDKVVIGALFAQTGPAAGFGEQEFSGFQFYVDEVNAAGGINGHQIGVHREDDTSAPQGAISGYQALAADSGVLAIAGPTTTAEVLATKPISERSKVPFVSFTLTASLAKPPTTWWYRATFDSDQVLKALLGYFKKQGFKTVAFIHADDAFGQAGLDAAKSNAPNYGIKIVAEVAYPASVVDPTPQALTAINTHPDAYIAWDSVDPSRLARVVTSLRNNGATETIGAPETAGEQTFKDAAGAAAEGVAYWAAFAADEPLPGPQADFIKKYTKKTGHEPSDATAGGYAMGQIIVGGIQKVLADGGKLTRQSVRNAIEGLSGFKTAYGTLTYAPDGHGTPFNQLVIAVYKDGQRRVASQITVE